MTHYTILNYTILYGRGGPLTVPPPRQMALHTQRRHPQGRQVPERSSVLSLSRKKVHLTPSLHNLILCRPIHRQMSDGLTLEQICQMTDPRGSMTSTLLCAAFTAFL